jgi:hypothetical protein
MPVAGVEIKCFNADKHTGIINKDEIPNDNLTQVHWSLAVTKLPSWVVCFYCPEAYPLDVWVIEVTPNEFTARVEEAMNDFVAEYKAKWQVYLAEYEVDKVKINLADRLPVTNELTK